MIADAIIGSFLRKLHYAKRRGRIYDKINAEAFILEVASQLRYAKRRGRIYDKIHNHPSDSIIHFSFEGCHTQKQSRDIK